jgi:CRISPR-associated protein Cas1
MPLAASVNRNQWKEEHFVRTSKQVWLSQEGRRLAIEIYEKRKQERWKPPVLGYSLSYARAIELEVRLLEKEWSGSPGLFGNLRIR